MERGLGDTVSSIWESSHAIHNNQRRVVVVAIAIVGLSLLVGCAVPTQALNPSRVRDVVPLTSTCDDPSTPRTITALGRSAAIYFPVGTDLSKPHPLLVSLHPFSMGAYDWDFYSGIVESATDRGYIVILPEGASPGPGWSVPGGNASDFDDVAWVDALIQEAARVACIDAERVYSVGFSAGAALTVGLSCELPGRFSAIAGSGGVNLTSLCPDADPVNALIMHGTHDNVVPITGNVVPFAASPPIGVNEVVSSFTNRNQCVATPTTTYPTSTQQRHSYACGHAEVVDIRILGMGHTWAGAFGLIDFFVGPNDTSFSATTTVLDFFDAN